MKRQIFERGMTYQLPPILVKVLPIITLLLACATTSCSTEVIKAITSSTDGGNGDAATTDNVSDDDTDTQSEAGDDCETNDGFCMPAQGVMCPEDFHQDEGVSGCPENEFCCMPD